MTVITMSRNELTRLRVLIDVADGRLSVADATGLIGVGRRQIYRLLQAFRADGADGLISRKRGGPSNRALGSVFRETVLAIVRERYADFGPTLAAEKLSELHGLDLGVETLRQWMIGAGIWVRRKERLKRIHQPRARRDCLGELVKIDGSEHWWFEDRGPQSTLLVYVDDATSRLMHLKFVETESTFDYFQATREYLEAHGKPVAFYSDKHGVFRVNSTGAVQGDGMTQFGRSLHALNIDILCANTPQAKGRVERANKTLKDRLVKELRLQGIGTIAAGNLSAEAGGRRPPLDPAREIERRGFAGISVSSSFGNMSQSVGLALATERIPFATAIVPIYAQSVDEFAQNCAYLHEVSVGRFQFGIGIAHAPAYLRMGA